MSTATTDLRTAHLSAAALIADLDLDDPALWRQVDSIVAALATVTYDLTATVTGEAAGAAARSAPPVVRARELAAAQRRLFHALDRHPAPAGELVERASRRLHQIGRELRCVLVSDVPGSRSRTGSRRPTRSAGYRAPVSHPPAAAASPGA